MKEKEGGERFFFFDGQVGLQREGEEEKINKTRRIIQDRRRNEKQTFIRGIKLQQTSQVLSNVNELLSETSGA